MVQIEKCLICSVEVSPKHKPFCSMRCKDLDLGKWFNEKYRVQTEEKLEVIDSSQIEVDERNKF